MRRRSPRLVRAALDAASIPIWTPRPLAVDARGLRFSQAPATLAPGQRVYAVGGARGEIGLLQTVHEAIRDDLAARPIARATVIHLGDMIGAEPAAAIRLIASPDLDGRVVTVRGDREQTLLEALDGGAAAATDWRHETGASAVPELPACQLDFLRGLSDFHRAGGYFFAHAGVRPGIPLTLQTGEDLRGIRQVFLSSEQSFGAVVVHGHSVVASPVVLPNRIAIDTGAGLGGRLTCAVLEADRVGFLSFASPFPGPPAGRFLR